MATQKSLEAESEQDVSNHVETDKEVEVEPTSTPSQTSDLVLEKTVSTAQSEYEYVTGIKLTLVIASVTLVCFLIMLDLSIIVTAIPHITNEFHSLPDVGWYGSAYQLANASLQPLTGKLYTYFSSKWTFLIFFGVFELGSLLCGVATSSTMLIIGRAVAGLGGSGLMNGGLTILSTCVPLQKRPLYLGVMMGIAQIGVVIGPLLGGAFTEYTTWRWCFYINLPIGAIVAILLLLINIPDRIIKEEGKWTIHQIFDKLDIVGFLIFAPASVMFFMALEWGGYKYAWGSATIIGLFCGAAGTFCVFLLWEYRRGDAAMIPFSMVRKRIMWSSCIVMFFFMGLMLICTYYLPIYFQSVNNATPMLSGVYVLPSILSQIFMAVIAGVFVGKLGYYIPWSLGSAVFASIGAGLFSTMSTSTTIGQWIGYQILIGAGRGAGVQMPLIAVQNALPQSQISVAMSILVFSQTFGGAVFLTFGETVFSNSLLTGLTTYAPSVNPEAVINAGATAFRDVVSADDLGGVLMAYSKAIDNTFYLAVGASIGYFIFAWGMGWKDIRKNKKDKKPATPDEEV